MAITKEFISAWYAWQHADAPILNSRERRFSAASYEIEVTLDHLISSVYSLGLQALEGENLNYGRLASEELSELDQINTKLKESGIDEKEKAAFAEYILLTRTLIEQIRKLPYAHNAV